MVRWLQTSKFLLFTNDQILCCLLGRRTIKISFSYGLDFKDYTVPSAWPTLYNGFTSTDSLSLKVRLLLEDHTVPHFSKLWSFWNPNSHVLNNMQVYTGIEFDRTIWLISHLATNPQTSCSSGRTTEYPTILLKTNRTWSENLWGNFDFKIIIYALNGVHCRSRCASNRKCKLPDD